jgi:hypothetical protein
MYLEASSRITGEILNVCGSLRGKTRREKTREILNVFRIGMGKSRNVYEVNKRKNRRKLGCNVKLTRERTKRNFGLMWRYNGENRRKVLNVGFNWVWIDLCIELLF